MTYDAAFFDYVDSGAIRSARALTTNLYPLLQPASVLDVGCGRGGWLKAWREAGCRAIVGIDGDYVDLQTLYIERAEFQAVDLSRPFDLNKRFDVVQCLEVAEHLPKGSSEQLVEGLARHGDIVLFSAAQPGQGGTQHINERPLSYWRGQFFSRGYKAYDCVRPVFHADAAIEPWYRFNTVLYANAAGERRLPDSIRRTLVPEGTPLRNFLPPVWRLRRAVLRFAPVWLVDRLAEINAKLKRARSPS